MGDCQNYGPFLDPYYNTAPNIQGTQKGTISLTTTHIGVDGVFYSAAEPIKGFLIFRRFQNRTARMTTRSCF